MNNEFNISSRIIYTIESAHGKIECEGIKGLESHVEATLGAFIDRMHSDHTGNLIKDKMRDFDYITKNAEDLKTILALRDSVEEIKNPKPYCECDDDDR